MKHRCILLIIFITMFCFGKMNAQPTSLGDGLYSYDIPWPTTQNVMKIKPVIKVDNNGNVWIGTNYYDGHGLIKFDGTNWSSVYNVSSGNLPNNRVNCIESSGNNLYVGTDGGIGLFDGINWATYNQSNTSMSDSIIKCIMIKNNIMWMGTNKGLNKFDGTNWINYTVANAQLISDSITALEQTANGDIWIATKHGLSKLSGNIVTNYDTINSNIKDENILSLRVDNANFLWVGTNSKGLYKLIINQFVPVSELYPPYKIFPAKIKSISKSPLGGVIVSIIPDPTDDFSAINTLYGYIHFGDEYKRYILNNLSGNYSWDLSNNKIYSVSTVANQLYTLKLDESRTALAVEVIDTNNISALISNAGMLFWDGYSFGHCEVPKGSSKSTMFSANLWVGAKDNLDTLHFAGERYMQIGRDWAPGPVMDSVFYMTEKLKWDRLWKVSKTEINYHKAHWQEMGYQISNSILKWPGDGDTTKGQLKQIAPYFDYNANRKYDPQNGDYPIIKGDQALFFIFNDDRVHTESSGNRLRIEVHGMAYEFNTANDSAIKNTLFINYRIYNRSQNNYNSMYVGMFSDFDLGDGYDDYIGCDSAMSMYYVQNGDEVDGTGRYNHYGLNPPAMGVAFLNTPLNSFIFFNNYGGNPAMMDPYIAPEYYNYLNARWKDGTHLTFGGDGYGSGINTNFMLSGKQFYAGSPWTEQNMNNAPGDRRGLGAAGPWTFATNSSKCLDLAYTYARGNQGANSSVVLLKQNIASVKNTYNNSLFNSCGSEFVIPGNALLISGTSTVCQGENEVVYSVPPIANATSYIWTLPNGATGTSSVNYISVVFGSNAVSGNVTVKGYNLWGHGTTSIFPVVVNPSPLAAGSIVGSTYICLGQNSTSYTVSSIANATSYVWTLPNGATGTSTTNNITVTYGINAISGNISVYGINSCDSGSVSTLAINVSAAPFAAGVISGNNAICLGESPTTYTIPEITNATSYVWSLPYGATGSSTTNSITVNYGSTATSGNITVKGQNSCGFGTVSTLPITVTSLPVSSGTIAGSASIVPGQLAATYTAPTITNATSYVWTLSNGMTGNSTSNNIIVNFNTSTLRDTICVKGTNVCGESSTSCLVINKEAVTNLYRICYVEYDTLMSKNNILWATPPANAQTVNIYSEVATNTWGLIGTIPATQTHYIDMTSTPLNQSFSYRISMVDNLGVEGAKSQYHKTITLLKAYDQMSNTYGFTWSPYEGIVVPNYLLFGMTSTGNVLQIASLTGNTHFYNYTNPSSAFVKYFIGFYTPSCNSKTDYIVRSNFVNSVTSGVDEYESSNLVIYPNPVSDQLTIEIEGNSQKINFNILNGIGQIVYTGTITDKNVVETSHFAHGIYMIKLENGKTVKFVKSIKS